MVIFYDKSQYSDFNIDISHISKIVLRKFKTIKIYLIFRISINFKTI